MLQSCIFLLFLIQTLFMKDVLVSCPLFLGMDKNEIEELFKRIEHQIRRFDKDSMIAQSSEEITDQLIVVEGSVKGEMMDFSGKTIKIEDIHSPRPLAPAFLFGKNNRYPVNIVANEAVAILMIPKTSFIRMMQVNEKVLSNFMNIISNRAQFLTNKIKFLSFQSIKGKLAHYLLQRMKQSQSELIILDNSQVQLAELFGVTRPSLGRAIREMDQEGIIEARGKQIRIVERARLSALLK